MRALWTKGEASFEGKYVNFPAIRSYPRPAQPAGPPVLLGSRDKNALKRVAKWGDGWCPIRISVDEMKQATVQLREECDKAGRDPATMRTSVNAFIDLDGTTPPGGLPTLSGSVSAVVDQLGQYAELGFDEFILPDWNLGADSSERADMVARIKAEIVDQVAA